jgi:hypothetical protein
VAEGAEIVAEMDLPGGLDPREHAWHGRDTTGHPRWHGPGDGHR